MWIAQCIAAIIFGVPCADPPAHVMDGIYIGSLDSVPCAPVARIINLSGVEYETAVPVLNVALEDAPITSGVVRRYITTLVAVSDWIGVCGGPILVHCAAGVNRSALAIGFHLLRCGYSLECVYSALGRANTQRRVCLLTNQSFRRLLEATHAMAVEYRLRKNNSAEWALI